jgi:hypothetical protein
MTQGDLGVSLHEGALHILAFMVGDQEKRTPIAAHLAAKPSWVHALTAAAKANVRFTQSDASHGHNLEEYAWYKGNPMAHRPFFGIISLFRILTALAR